MIIRCLVQIVRVDLKELLDMPLDGAPYAYTPFCDDRREMDGFRSETGREGGRAGLLSAPPPPLQVLEAGLLEEPSR